MEASAKSGFQERRKKKKKKQSPMVVKRKTHAFSLVWPKLYYYTADPGKICVWIKNRPKHRCSPEHFRVLQQPVWFLTEPSQELVARKGGKTFPCPKMQVCRVLFLSSNGLSYLFKVPQSFLWMQPCLFSCFKRILPWRWPVLPAAICLSPKHSSGSWQFKNTPTGV